MKTIIMAGYLAGIIYQLLCTDVVKYFGDANREAFEEIMGRNKAYEPHVKMVHLIVSITMFIAMIIAMLVWPVGLLWNLWIQIKVKYLFWKTMKKLKKLEKEFKELLGRDF